MASFSKVCPCSSMTGFWKVSRVRGQVSSSSSFFPTRMLGLNCSMVWSRVS